MNIVPEKEGTVLVSIVVPIYDIEPALLDTCLSSIERQTYKPIEVVAIDDGSAGDYCYGYSAVVRAYDFARLTRIEHGGVCAARNKGVELSRGAYIGFADADDYLKDTMIEVLLGDIESTDADVSCVAAEIRQTSGRITSNMSLDGKHFAVSGIDATRALLSGDVSESVYDKLFARDSVQGNAFRIDLKMCEDACYVADCFMSAHRVSIRHEALYCYQRREGSTTKAGFTEAHLDAIRAACLISKKVEVKDPSLSSFSKIYYLRKVVGCIRAICRDGANLAFNQEIYKETKSKVREFLSENKDLALGVRLGIETKLACGPLFSYRMAVRVFDLLRR